MKAKLKEFFSIKSKLKLIIFSVISSLVFLLSILMTVPGVGLEAKRFIDSIEKQIKEVMPQGVYVIEASDPTYEAVMNSVIKSAYSSDAVSTLNSYQETNYQQKKEAYIKFSDDWFNKRWSSVIEKKQDVDLYDLGMDLVQFDQAVSTEFLSYGYVHSGIQWFFQNGGIKDIFSKERFDDLKRNQTSIDQETYNSYMDNTPPGTEGITINQSIGTLLVNNKVWFLNLQIENIKYGFSIFGHSIFKNKELKETNMPKKFVTKDELYTPFFTNNLEVLRSGIIMFFIYIIFILPISAYAITMLAINLKKGSK